LRDDSNSKTRVWFVYVLPHILHGDFVYEIKYALTKRFVVKITVERCDVFLVGVPQIFDRVKSIALWSAKKKN
jgi:hypothetical protein